MSTGDEEMEPARRNLHDKLSPIGQEHLLAFWSRLSQNERQTLIQQLEAIDAQLFAELGHEFRQQKAAASEESKWAALAAQAEPPQAMRLDGSGVPFTADEARGRGAELLRRGEVGMILVAGGLGTRLGFDQPKGMFPIGPLSNRTLFQVLLENLRAVQRRYGVRIPLFVMTSPATDEVTRQYLNEQKWFGLPPDDCRIFCQATMWAVDERFERLLLECQASSSPGQTATAGCSPPSRKAAALPNANSGASSICSTGRSTIRCSRCAVSCSSAAMCWRAAR